jgi:hypothetical protein
LFPVALILALFGTPALGSAQGAGASGTDHPPMIQLATLPGPVRLLGRSRRARRRRISSWIARRLPAVASVLGFGHQRIRPRRPPHDSYARGPPGALMG